MSADGPASVPPSEPRPADAPDPAEQLSRRLDLPMSLLGIAFLLVVLAEPLVRSAGLRTALVALAWCLWAVFVAEFALRAWVADDRRQFWRRSWWQLLLLLLPFLRFVRLLGLFRLAMVGRSLSSAVRGSRSAGVLLSGRVAWLSAVTVVVIMASSHLLYGTGAYRSYGEALHRTALAAITGEPLAETAHVAARILDVVLGAYSVIVFATLAGSLGAYFLGRRPADGDG